MTPCSRPCHYIVCTTEKLTVSFSRSSGPGGQNVNKCELVHLYHAWGGAWPYAMVMNVFMFLVVNTKAEVRFHVNSADWIPERVKHRVHSMVGRLAVHSATVVAVTVTHCGTLLSSPLPCAVQKPHHQERGVGDYFAAVSHSA